MTIYDLEFLPSARKEWDKLGTAAQRQFAKKLRERLHNPRVPSARLRDMADCYKIKLRKSGYRLVYRVLDERIIVQVIAIGKREHEEAYRAAAKRL
ncbi:mRNA interferase RelE/StbE [Sphingopyxis italica]|uniref:mRNA interferase RelE/StbE n=1 Tax=Sphingopyxis italica TaxID=1129133 RepID=A0A7X6B8X1_9SPHN|nr:type II toxin-antitoxin system RelE/ParE family toxin [Sphingopyxis italica]NJB88848.1 mRNA interferase RelE/StbE [Sphingopyxis italica]